MRASWSESVLVADDREPAPGRIGGYLFVPAGCSSAAYASLGWLLPNLTYFSKRSSLNNPLALRNAFERVFEVQETSLDRLLSPAIAQIDGNIVSVLRGGCLQFAR